MSDMHKRWKNGLAKEDNITQAEYDAMQLYWSSDEFKSISKRNAKNRRGGNSSGPAPPTHTSGSRPHYACALDFKAKHGRMPTHMEIYDALHRYLEKLEFGYVRGDFINVTSFSLAENFKKRKAELLKGEIIDLEEPTPIDNEVYFECLPGKRHGYWRGSKTHTTVTPIGGFNLEILDTSTSSATSGITLDEIDEVAERVSEILESRDTSANAAILAEIKELVQGLRSTMPATNETTNTDEAHHSEDGVSQQKNDGLETDLFPSDDTSFDGSLPCPS